MAILSFYRSDIYDILADRRKNSKKSIRRGNSTGPAIAAMLFYKENNRNEKLSPGTLV